MTTKTMITTLLMLCALGCGGGETSTTTSSGNGGSTTTDATGEGGTGGEAGTGGASATTTTATAPAACDDPIPAGCSYPDPFAGWYPMAAQSGAFIPAPGRQEGASASCFDPLGPDALTRAAIGFPGDPPAELPIDAWLQEGNVISDHVPSPQLAMLEATEAGDGGLTFGVYLLTSPLSGEGLVPCVALRVKDHLPVGMVPSDACYQPRRAWWLGLPADPNGPHGLTWAPMFCPVDDSILSSDREFPYALRP